MAALSVSWESVTRVSQAPAPVVTGEDADETPVPAAKPTRPVIAWVTDGGSEFDKLEEVVFKTEKIALGLKAFRTVKLSSEDAEQDPLLAGKGTEVPRILVVDAESKVRALEKNRLTATGLFDAMKKSASTFYTESLDKIVKEHLKILTEIDKLSDVEALLSSKEAKLKQEGASDKEMAEVKKDLEEARKQLEDLAAKQREIWKLTAKPSV
jgi:hypothetical protein